MRKQYAVFGLGSFGESVAVTLQVLGCEVVVVDNHMERIEDISPYVSYAVQADIEDPEVIRSLGARNLDGVVVAVADDMEASIMATLVSKEIGVPYVLAKAKNELHAKVLKKIGADSIIFPEKEIGQSVARNLVSGDSWTGSLCLRITVLQRLQFRRNGLGSRFRKSMCGVQKM